ncbi:hypothetical protein [Bacillus haynesii]|uniref:hypothetical protein n=1 Tax=Bacillus haynesii TaxID=1925021 RepID=UPI0022817C47|nr:hypothetical protein [Bacillus haynesii]MCY7789882.1 hypothetical protein [Bacillus haynesii]MCY8074239.1 hypothetical protein [Bacillus haynesii]MCY8539697.1 hypothetical protein [Bacillus haynesii]MCY9225545.1 hypothetical protein [Bacillus haynesii]
MKIKTKEWLALSEEARANLIQNEALKNCQHANSETIQISGTYETFTVCHDCGAEI